jgi:membrane protein implicated in regulation of membrane protease activity
MDSQFKISVFLVSSVGIAWFSRRSLKNARSHGFYRFFAWELILALVLLNLDVWFAQPFSWHQLISWPLLSISLYLIIHAVLHLRREGKPGSRGEDPALIGIEKTTRLCNLHSFNHFGGAFGPGRRP